MKGDEKLSKKDRAIVDLHDLKIHGMPFDMYIKRQHFKMIVATLIILSLVGIVLYDHFWSLF